MIGDRSKIKVFRSGAKLRRAENWLSRLERASATALSTPGQCKTRKSSLLKERMSIAAGVVMRVEWRRC
jgi:hypothetical protein